MGSSGGSAQIPDEVNDWLITITSGNGLVIGSCGEQSNYLLTQNHPGMTGILAVHWQENVFWQRNVPISQMSGIFCSRWNHHSRMYKNPWVATYSSAEACFCRNWRWGKNSTYTRRRRRSGATPQEKSYTGLYHQTNKASLPTRWNPLRNLKELVRILCSFLTSW